MAQSIEQTVIERLRALSPERQREALALIEQLAARAAATKPHLPRAQRQLKGATARGGAAVSREEIDEARREMWRGYMGEDEA